MNEKNIFPNYDDLEDSDNGFWLEVYGENVREIIFADENSPSGASGKNHFFFTEDCFSFEDVKGLRDRLLEKGLVVKSFLYSDIHQVFEN